MAREAPAETSALTTPKPTPKPNMKSLRQLLLEPPIIIGSRNTPTCGRRDCDIAEQPEHWVDVELTPIARGAINVLPELEMHLTTIRDASDNAGPETMAVELRRINTLARVALVAIANIKPEERPKQHD